MRLEGWRGTGKGDSGATKPAHFMKNEQTKLRTVGRICYRETVEGACYFQADFGWLLLFFGGLGMVACVTAMGH